MESLILFSPKKMNTSIQKKLVYSLFVLAFWATAVFASQSDIDPGFDIWISPGFNNIVWATTPQSDGKLIVYWDFTTYQWASANRIVRINKDGSRDTTFDIGNGFNSSVKKVLVQSGGKILIAWSFTTYKGSSANRIIRLNDDGSVDTTFDIGNWANGTVWNLVSQADQTLVVGDFSTYKGASAPRIMRLNQSGAIDTGFSLNVGVWFNGGPRKIVLQNDGKIMALWAWFSTYQGTTANKVVRLNADWTRDMSFVISSWYNNSLTALAVQDDGKVIIGAYSSSTALFRLNADWSYDNTFNVSSSLPGTNIVRDIKIQVDGKIIVAWVVWSNYLIRLNTNGSKDNSFAMGAWFWVDDQSSWIFGISLDADGNIILAGTISSYQWIPASKITKLYSNGSMDTWRDLGRWLSAGVATMITQSDNKTIIAGNFLNYKWMSSSNKLVRLNADGSMDTWFNIGAWFDSTIGYIPRYFVIQPDGKIIAGGYFLTYQWAASKCLVRINSDGSRDSSFVVWTWFDWQVNTLILQADGKIIAGGGFSKYQGVSSPFIIRLNSDGSRDTSFVVWSGFDATVYTMGLQSDGKLVVGGSFSKYQWLTGKSLIRLNTDGSRDNTFDVWSYWNGWSNSNYPRSLFIQSDGKIISNFVGSASSEVRTLMRFNTDWSRDTSFTERYWAFFYILATQSDDKFFINTSASQVVMKLNADGSLDGTFPQYTFGWNINAGSLQSDGKLVVGGDFVTYKWRPLWYLVRLLGNSDVVTLPNSINTGDINNAFLAKGYTENNGLLFGTTPISLGETNWIIPTRLNIMNSVGSLYFSQGTQVINSSGNNNYSWVIYVPLKSSFLKSIFNMSVLGTLNINSSSNSLVLSWGSATISVPISGNVGDRVYIYYSNDNKASWYPEKVAKVTSQDWGTYVNFSTNHLAEFAILSRSGTYTGSFWINNNTSTTNNRNVTLNIYTNPISQMMRFSNDNTTRSPWESYSITKTWTLAWSLWSNTVYTQFDLDGDNISDMELNSSITYNDITAPIITLIGNSTIEISQHQSYIESGAIAIDDRDGDISQNIIISGNINTNISDTYIITYNVSDAAGNPATTITRTITVIPDTTAPIITLVGDPSINIPQWSIYSDAGATALDNIDGDVSSNIITSGSVDTSILWTYEITYSITDSDWNAAIPITRYVTVDTKSAPTALVSYSTTGTVSGDVIATIGDFSESITWLNEVSHTFTWNGIFTFTFEDLYGNTGSAIANVFWIDKTPPTAFVVYNITWTTDNDVIATLTWFSEPIAWWSVLNHIFTGNGSFLFTFRDLVWNFGNITATVDRINKTAINNANTSIGWSNSSFIDFAPKPVQELSHSAAEDKPTISIKNSTYTPEINTAYVWAYNAGITTIPTVQAANIEGKVYRSHLAKMISEYAINVLKKPLNTGLNCSFPDMKNQSQELQQYSTTACQLGLMGLKTDWTPDTKFNPNAEITRAQFATTLSRLLRGNKNSTGSTYYEGHLQALKKAWIMTKISTPSMKELRWYVMIMLQRAATK